jgi:ABC-type transport system involved in cytochrome c biogenesis permease subunit
MAAVTALLYLGYRAVGGEATYARVGGAAALLEVESSDPALRPRRSPGEVFDGATMVLMELSFVMLWAGIVMGAIWADHSWGRPWGWDPKEVFALNTFIVFLVLVHIRLKARDKGLWTAVLAVIGCGVMLFNWIVINFIISGLHSYA